MSFVAFARSLERSFQGGEPRKLREGMNLGIACSRGGLFSSGGTSVQKQVQGPTQCRQSESDRHENALKTDGG